MSEVENHSQAASNVIAAELVACTLGQRDRPELHMTERGRYLRALNSGLIRLGDRGRRIAAEVATYRYWAAMGAR